MTIYLFLFRQVDDAVSVLSKLAVDNQPSPG